MFKLFFSLFFLLFFIACDSSNSSSVDSPTEKPLFIGEIKDSKSWYDDMSNEALEIIITIPKKNEYLCSPWDNLSVLPRPCTLDDIYNDTNASDTYEPVLHVYMRTNKFESTNGLPNAEFKQKGKTTRGAIQKSYRIKLDSKEVLFGNERTFQLNKHPFDGSRVKNKLAFDLFRTIPNITSLKTEFINLIIIDERTSSSSYGLFTHVEAVGEEFLKNHGFGPDDYLYKAQEFEFTIDPRMSIDSNGKAINKDEFDQALEAKNGKDHSNLNTMLQLVNAPMTDSEFEIFFAKYFNRDNYMVWLATNLVMANKDTVSQNYYLYNPKYSNTFYFMPWDYDGAGRPFDRYAKWELGISTWWGNPLHSKFLKIAKNREDLYALADLLREKYITPKIIKKYLADYQATMERFMSQTPDVNNLDYDIWYDEYWNVLVSRLDENIYNYKSQIGHPMSFWHNALYSNSSLTLEWDRSIDFEGDELVYDLKLIDELTFRTDENGTHHPVIQNIVFQVDSIADQNVETMSYTKTIDLLPGTYYLQVIAREKENPLHYQIGFETDVQITYNIDGKSRTVIYPGFYEIIIK